MKPLASLAAASITALTMTMLATAPASAQEDPTQAAVAAASAVAPDQGQVASAIESPEGSGLIATTGSSSVDLPSTTAGTVDVRAEGLEAVSIPLPTVESTATAALGSDGSAVYNATSEAGVTVLAQVMTDEAVRIQTISHSPESPSEFSYDFEGSSAPMIADDGSVVVVDTSNPESATVLSVDDPWAFDAAGAPVPTWYELRGASLVQHIAPSADAVYPIVADPRWEWQSWGYGMALNKRETRDLASSGAATGGCVVFGAAAPACAVLGAQIFTQANIAKNNGQCIFLQVAPAPVAWRYSGGYCR